jgi:hypothetical protein
VTLETFKAALEAAAVGGLPGAQEMLDRIERLGHFSYHCLVNALRDMPDEEMKP